jgi:hypothetical protein
MTLLSRRDEAIAYAPSAKTIATAARGRTRLGGLDIRVEQHVFATLSAVQINAQVKDAGAPMALLGPHPWRPPE